MNFVCLLLLASCFFLLCLPADEAPLHIHFVRCPLLPGGPHVNLRWVLHILRHWMYHSSESHCFLDSCTSGVLSDIATISVYSFHTFYLLMCGFEWYVCNLDMNRLQSSQTWLLDVRDLNNRGYSFSETCANENSSSLFMTSNRAGAQSGLICSWMWEAVETVACLACVCVAEVVEGWRRRGHQWATAGVPQFQPSTCCYHNWQAEPQTGTNSLPLTEVEAVDAHTGLVTFTLFLAVHLSPSCQLVSSAAVLWPCLLTCLSLSLRRTKNSSTWSSPV